MKRISPLILLALALSMPLSAFAQTRAIAGNEFLRRCDGPFTNEMERLAFTSYCTGFIQGLQQMQHIVIGLRSVPPLYCEPTETGSYEQLERVIVKWLKSNPEQLHRDARVLITVALMQAFPCEGR